MYISVAHLSGWETLKSAAEALYLGEVEDEALAVSAVMMWEGEILSDFMFLDEATLLWTLALL